MYDKQLQEQILAKHQAQAQADAARVTTSSSILDTQGYTSLDGHEISLRNGEMPMTNITGPADSGRVTVYDRSSNTHHVIKEFDEQYEADDFVANFQKEVKAGIVEQNYRTSSPAEIEAFENRKIEIANERNNG